MTSQRFSSFPKCLNLEVLPLGWPTKPARCSSLPPEAVQVRLPMSEELGVLRGLGDPTFQSTDSIWGW